MKRIVKGFGKLFIGGIIFLIVIGIMVSMCGKEEVTKEPEGKTVVVEKQVEKPKAPKVNPDISKKEFDQLKSGMTYEEAVKIIGGPGEIQSESGNKGEALHTVMYMWEGEKGFGANASVMFQGGKLNMKSQAGLE